MRWILILSFSTMLSAADLKTVAEKSNWKETGRYDEVVQLCHRFQRAYPNLVRCEKFGKTPEGRPMVSLIANGTNLWTPQALALKQVPIIFFQGGIHSGEIDGKDAGFLLLREILEGKVAKNALKSVVLVFVPVFNIDGHERFGKNQRPHQNGPVETGWRTTAQNLNLNRDYVKAESPEMQAMLKLLKKWNPIVYLDLHATDGARHRQDISVMVAPSRKVPGPLTEIGKQISDRLLKDLAAYHPLDFYPAFIKDDEPDSGFEVGISPPRFSQSYWALRNRIGVLVETNSWAEYSVRVKSTRDLLASVIEQAKVNGKSWIKRSHETEKLFKDSKNIDLVYEPTQKQRPIDFLGYAYEFSDSVVTGKQVIRYDLSKPVVWKVPFFEELEAKFTVVPPIGYAVPPEHAEWVKKKLDTHGIRHERIPRSTKELEASRFRTNDFEFSKSPYEGRTGLTVKGEWQKEKQALSPGWIYVPTDQPYKRLILHLFEPAAPDSLLSWGFFNAHFERKEYVELYVLEPWAREELKRNATLQSDFEKAKENQSFEESEEARIDFLTDRHPARDKRYKRYPVLQLHSSPFAR